MRARCLLAALGLAACSSSSSSSPSPSPAADGGAPEASSLTVWVYDLPFWRDAPQPLGGATVAFDAPGAERVVATTDGDGKAVVAFDPARGAGIVTAFAKDHVATTMFGVDAHASQNIPGNQLDKPASDFVMFLPLSASGVQARTVALGGAITNVTKSGDRVNVGPSVIGTIFDAPRTQYALRVPKDRPFFLLGAEYTFDQPDARSFDATIVKFFRIDRPPMSADGSFDIDLAAAPPVPFPSRHVHLVIPGGDAGPLGGRSIGTVNVATPDGFFIPGVIAKAAPSADKNGFDCDVAVAQVDTGGAPLLTLGTIRAMDGASSQRAEIGVVADGTTLDGFMIPPTFAASSAKLAQPIDVSGMPADANFVRLVLGDGADAVWIAYMRRDSGATLAMPAPPSGLALPSSLTGQLGAFSDVLRLPNGFVFPKALSQSKPFDVTR